MCKETEERAEARDEPQGAESRGRGGCPCESRRCLPVAGAVLAVVALPLVIGAIRRAHRSRRDGEGGRRPASCCA